jgi:UDP-glucose 4-epimerase
MRILITGSEGSLMQELIPKLLAQGHEIVGVDNLYRYNALSELANKQYQFIQQDLIDAEQVSNIVKDVDAVIHAAARVYGVLGLVHYRADILGDEVTMARNVLNACVKNNIKHIVYMSSSMVYDACIQDVNVPVTENMPFESLYPNTDYGLGKLVCERLCKAYYHQYGINYTIWRPFNIVSPHEISMKDQGFSHVIPDFVENIVNKKLNPVPVIGDGNQIRCFTWIGDIVDIMSKYSFDDRAKNEIFNVCNVEPISMKELASLIYTTKFNNETQLAFTTTKDYEHDVKVRIPSIDKLTSTFGEITFTPVAESIRQCLQ